MSWSFFKKTRKLDEEIADHRVGERLLSRVRRLLDKWEPIIGVKIGEVRTKKMSTYWATINEGDSRLWLDTKLAKESPGFLQYVIVHELVHLRTNGHDGKFYALMDKHLPGWRRYHEAKAGPMTQHS